MRPGWHGRPVIAPVVYGLSVFVTGSLSYTAGYLLTGRISRGIYLTLFMYSLLVLYWWRGDREYRRSQ